MTESLLSCQTKIKNLLKAISLSCAVGEDARLWIRGIMISIKEGLWSFHCCRSPSPFIFPLQLTYFTPARKESQNTTQYVGCTRALWRTQSWREKEEIFRHFVVLTHCFQDGKWDFSFLVNYLHDSRASLKRRTVEIKEMRNLVSEIQNHISTLILFEEFHAPNQRLLCRRCAHSKCWNYTWSFHSSFHIVRQARSRQREERASRKREKRAPHIWNDIRECQEGELGVGGRT